MRRFAFRYLLKQKKTTFSIIIGIALTVIMMFSLIQMGDSIAVRYKSLLIKGMQYDFSMRDMTDEKQTELANSLTNGKYNVDSYLILNESCFSALPSNGMPISILGSKGDAASVFGFELAEGTYPSKPYEVCVEERINTYSDITYEIGDSITLAVSCDNGIQSTNENFVITGFVKDLPTSGSFLMMSTTLETAEDISHKQNYDDSYARSIFVTVDQDKFDQDNVYAMMCQMGYGPLLDIGIQYEMNDAKMQAYEQSVGDSYVSVALRVLTIALSIASIFLIYNSINMSVTEKIRQYGTFRCLGMKRSQLTHMVLIEVLIYSILGIGMGMALGLVLNLCVAQSIMSLILGGEVILAQRPVTYLFVLLLASAVIGVSTFLSIHRLQKLTPVQAMKYTEAEHFKKRSFLKKRHENKAAKRNAFMLHFAARNLSRNRGKTAVTFVSIFISALLCMVILNFFLSINPSENVGMNVQLAKYQLYYSGDLGTSALDDSNDGYISGKLLEEIREIEGVDHVYSIGTNSFSYYHTMSINGTYFYNNLAILDDELIQKISDSYDLLPDDEIALFYETGDADLFDFPPDSIAVAKTDSTDSGVEFTMTEIEVDPYVLLSDYSSDGVLFVNDKLADRVFGTYDYSDLLIASNLTYDQLWAQIQALDGMNNQIQLADIEAGSEEAMNQLAGILLIAAFVMAFTAILAVLNISNTVRSNIQLRQSENGMLRAFGMTNKTLTRIICTENALTGLGAVAAASVAGILTAVVIFPQIDSKFHLIFWIYPLVGAVVFLTCILTAYIPMRSHWKTTIRAHIDE